MSKLDKFPYMWERALGDLQTCNMPLEYILLSTNHKRLHLIGSFRFPPVFIKMKSSPLQSEELEKKIYTKTPQKEQTKSFYPPEKTNE